MVLGGRGSEVEGWRLEVGDWGLEVWVWVLEVGVILGAADGIIEGSD